MSIDWEPATTNAAEYELLVRCAAQSISQIDKPAYTAIANGAGHSPTELSASEIGRKNRITPPMVRIAIVRNEAISCLALAITGDL